MSFHSILEGNKFFISGYYVQFCVSRFFMLRVSNISFSYRDTITLKNISFSIPKGQNTAIIGESGCGKSTLLQLIYGLYDLNEGQIFWNETEVLGPKFNLIPGMEFMKYLAQDFDLMPYTTVAENIGKFLSNRNLKKKEARVQELLAIVEMSEFASVKAQFLSGGQMQRVAIAKVLALEPEVLLLDEPFSHIDNFRKNSLRRKLFGYLKEKDITCIIATHDSKDILAFTDQTLVIQKGELLANAATKSLYNLPENRYIASLFDEITEIPKHFIEETEDQDAMVLLYPFQLQVVSDSTFKVEIRQSYFKGNGYLVEANFNNQPVFFENAFALEKGNWVFLALKP